LKHRVSDFSRTRRSRARAYGAGPIVGNHSTFGWGLNLASSLNFTENDSVQTQLTYGEGLFRYFNDDFVNNDADGDAFRLQLGIVYSLFD